MPPRKGRLEDARRRLQEKLDSIKEQSDYITQTLNSTISSVSKHNYCFFYLHKQFLSQFYHLNIVI